MRLNRRQSNALVRLFSARSAAGRIAALVVLIPLVFAVWQGCTPRTRSLENGAAGRIVGDVVAVSDGDTIRVLDADKRQHKVRFAFIDAPEKAQPYGMAAKQALSDRIYRKIVTVEVVDTDQYGRSVGRVWLGEQDVNRLQVEQGWAWHYRQFAKKLQAKDDYAVYEAAQKAAREGGLGLWADARPQAPWEWRRSRRGADRSGSGAHDGRRGRGEAQAGAEADTE